MTRNRTIVLCGAAAIALVVAAMIIPRGVGNLRGVFAPKSYDWVSRTMVACEEDAVTKPSTVNFLVVPLERVAPLRQGHGMRGRSRSWDARHYSARRTP